ncbi:T9SS type A sorting domain-containing protein [Seonamhaeicola sediminis]|uniref:T9SS type A sorting domain-containing protein n=1 Tax=Seonamhaeicola sediminis TaxID=2528206 RepID=A0A562YEX7_9FLAO|nr:LamG-like jellyroll fold domain-containing protein [Seonamhaeicola sediminis]TWO33227.1 T9SS type A sorting domain-containing protein [Seonamhaeicola sediminis]
MRIAQSLNLKYFCNLVLFFFFCTNLQSQNIQIEVIGGASLSQNDVVSITAGNAISFRITTTASSCANLRVQDITLTNSSAFSLSHSGLPQNIKPDHCKNGDKYMDFTVTNISGNCGASTGVTVSSNSDPDFLFTFTISGAPEINVLGGSPSADIIHGSTTTSATNGTYFGVIEAGVSETRYYVIANTGSCPLEVQGVISSSSEFAVLPYLIMPDLETAAPFTANIDPGSYMVLPVTFTAPPLGSGTYTSTISISNSDNTTYTFDVSAEMFNFNIPGPGGVTADFRLWLKSNRGINVASGASVSDWLDLGSNGKDATTVSGKEPTFLDTATDNINFNPVVKFENDGVSKEQYMYNSSNGFYSQDIFIVMIPDSTVTNASSGNTIFAGISSGSAGDMTGVGFGDYSSEFTNEILSYNQNIPSGGSYNGEAETSTSKTYSNAGIINIRNNAFSSPTGQEILYNSSTLTTTSVNDISFDNVGFVDPGPPSVVNGTEYWIGRNYDVQGSLNGRVAEIFTFAERVSDVDRQKIESYLAIKYGITLGTSTEAEKDYINSFGTSVWDISANTGYNYHVAGIGRDSISDLNQKQSKTLNMPNEVTIGLNGIFSTNGANINEFNKDGDFLVWGSNNDIFSGTNTNTVTIATGITTSLTRINRKWKIVESLEDGSSDVGNVFVSIPSAAFSSFALGVDEEYALIVADNANFADTDIIDVIPLKSDEASNLQTWYDFDGTKFFTFGKVSKLEENHSVNIASGDYLVGEYDLNLNINDFTISAWVKANSTQTSTRTIMAKGSKLQLRLNSSHQIEVMVDDDVTPRFTSTMVLNDDKWHQVTFVYNSGTIFLYVDGVLDKSEQNVVAPSPNYNRFSVGAIYVDKNNITNPFLGDIDEIYVWDQGLTQSQIRYLMNQEIEKGTGDFVTGKSLPQDASSNEVASIPWSKLKAYYDFNAFYGSTIEGLTDDRNFLRLKYLDKDKTLVEDQTIPVPYVSVAGGEWGNSATWANSSDQIAPNALSLDGSTYIDWNIVEIGHDITSGDKDITVLGLIQTVGTLTIADPVVVSPIENNDGQSLRVTHYLEIDGVIDLVGESQLIQDEGSVLDADSGGYIERDQQGTANAYNYNYWSSSVGPISGNTSTRGTGMARENPNYTISGVLNDGTDSSSYQSIDFDSSYNAADSDTPSIPRVVSTYWLYKFYGAVGDMSSWTSLNENSPLLPGEGYTMKGTSGSVAVSNNQNYVFKGLPNNGNIILELDKSSGDVERLIGNPYPCAIDADEFILDNIKSTETINGEIGRNTDNVINGALYFWHHFGDVDSHYMKDYVGGYATYTLMGGTEAYATDDLIDNSLPEVGGGKIPEKYIPVGQGFFVSTELPSGLSGTTSTVEGGTITFKNSQRVFVREGYTGINDGSLFFKSNNKSKQVEVVKKDSRPKIRLQFVSSKGYKRQLLIGADNHATDSFDLGYDALLVDINKDDMYWILDGQKFVIQGVSSFDSTKEYPLGLNIENSGNVLIKVDSFENYSGNAYLLDKETNETFLINSEGFQVSLSSGVYSDRFSLVFEPSDGFISKESNAIKVSTQYNMLNSELKLETNSIQNKIIGVQLFDFQGNKVVSDDLHLENSSHTLNIRPGIYVLVITTKKGVVSNKVVLGSDF